MYLSNPNWNRWRGKQVITCFIFQILWLTNYLYLFWELQNICKNQMKDKQRWLRKIWTKCESLKLSCCQRRTEDSHPLPILGNPGEFLVPAFEIKYWGEESTKEETALTAYNPKLNKWEQKNVRNRRMCATEVKITHATRTSMCSSRAKSLVSKYRSPHKGTRVSLALLNILGRVRKL